MTVIYCDKTALPKRDEWDFYPTSEFTVNQALSLISRPPITVLDPGAGSGVWGREARKRWPSCALLGVEMRPGCYDPAYDGWVERSFLDECKDAVSADAPYDLVMGNPPYRQAEAFIRTSLELLVAGGDLIFLLRLAFLEGQARRDGLFATHPPVEVAVCSKRPSFQADGKTNATAFAVFHWIKGFQGLPQLCWLK